MKRKVSVFIVLLAFVCLLCLPVSAAGGNYVVDDAGFLSGSELDRLEEAAAEVSEKYSCGVYILTVPDLDDMGYGSDPYVAAYSHYHDNSLGLGYERDGIILFISAEYMDYAVFVYGDGAEYAFDEYGLLELESEYIGYLSDRDWFNGFAHYISGCGRYLALAEEGDPVREGIAGSLGLGLIIGAAIAFIVCMILKAQLKSVRKATEALHYNVGGLNLSLQRDQFTHTTVTKTKIQTESKGGGSSSARSGGGGHGRSGRL